MWLVFCLSLCWGYRSFQWGGWCLAFLNLWLPVAAFRWPQEDSGILPENSRFRGFWEAIWQWKTRVEQAKTMETRGNFHVGSTAVTHQNALSWPLNTTPCTRIVAETCPQTGIVFMGKEPQPGEEDQRCLLASPVVLGPTVIVRYQLLFGPTCEAAAPCLRVCPMWQEPPWLAS